MPFLEVINGTAFEFYQVNGTKYYKNYKSSSLLPFAVRDQLEQCAGEMFLSNIPEHATADRIANIACMLGEMYILRFKVNFAGMSRGFAYLQYVNPGLMHYAIETLPHLFCANGFGQIRVRRSKNTSKLVLRNVAVMSQDEVENTLATMCNYKECNVRYLRGNKMEYQLVFGSNEDAVKARRILIGHAHVFGESATIGWDVYSK